MCDYCKKEDCPDAFGLYHCTVHDTTRSSRAGKSVKLKRCHRCGGRLILKSGTGILSWLCLDCGIMR